jgi:hypothetical protein
VIWNGTTPTLLGSLPGQTFSWATAINNAGTVAGFSIGDINNIETYTATIWNGLDPTALGELPGATDAVAYGVNSAGQVIVVLPTAIMQRFGMGPRLPILGHCRAAMLAFLTASMTWVRSLDLAQIAMEISMPFYGLIQAPSPNPRHRPCF